jgi:hypothetical protein
MVDALDAPGGGLQTEGGSVVTVLGANFGPPGAADVFLGGVLMTSFVTVNDTAGFFVAPAGVGGPLPVTMHVGGQWSSGGGINLAYDIPTLLSVSVLAGACVFVRNFRWDLRSCWFEFVLCVSA